MLAFGPEDRVRDHMISKPAPELAREFRIPDGCSACHANSSLTELTSWLDERFPERRSAGLDRARLFAAADRATREGTTPITVLGLVSELVPIVADESEDAWTRASAASLLGRLGRDAEGASSVLADAASSNDPVLARAALDALGRTGTQERATVAALSRNSPDWRIQLMAASALSIMGDGRQIA